MAQLDRIREMMGRSENTRKDVYENDIYYIGDRPADLSAQTITYLNRRLTGNR
jgi:hypothetical protein